MRRIVILLFGAFLFSGHTFQNEKLVIAVAANAQYVMKAIEEDYEKVTGVEIELIIGSSGKLSAQIREGAPFDVFLSADMEFPETLYRQGHAVSAPKIYGYGKLVLWTLRDISPLNIHTLLLKEIKTVAIANPKVAPYGEAAIAALKYFMLYEHVQSKLIYGESIAQVNQYIASETADIGFTAKSAVLSPEMAEKGKWVDIDARSYAPIAQGAVLLKSSLKRNKTGAEKFYTYLYGDAAKSIFKKYGYHIP